MCRWRRGLAFEHIFEPWLHAGVELNRVSFAGGGDLPLTFLDGHVGKIEVIRLGWFGRGFWWARRRPEQRGSGSALGWDGHFQFRMASRAGYFG